MLPQSAIHRSISAMMIDAQQATHRRARAADAYALGEFEDQHQYDFNGNVGTLPAEAMFAVAFKIVFQADAGNARDSDLDRPIFRWGIEMFQAPAGTVSYCHLQSWIYDDDYNFIGANLLVGAHYPGLLLPDATPPDDTSFRGLLHVAFQGWGAPYDPDGPFDAGGIFDSTGVN